MGYLREMGEVWDQIKGRYADKQSDADEQRKWHAFGMPKKLQERFRELADDVPKHVAAQRLLEELIGRDEPITPRKWSVVGLGPGWGNANAHEKL